MTNSTAKNGFTLTELVFSVALGAMILTIAVPAFDEILDRARLNTAMRQVVSDVREARSQAIAKGWEYRIVGYDTDSQGARRNQYRMLGRRSSAVTWPAEESAPFETATQKAGVWVDVSSAYTGVELDTGNPRFELTFDARGTAAGAAASFSPLTLIGDEGMQHSFSVSTVGGVRVQ